MKIVYCINNTWYAGGMTRVLANKANFLTEEGHEVFIITVDQLDNQSYYPLSGKIQHVDLDINYFKYDQKSSPIRWLGFIKNLLLHRKRLKRILTDLHADIVISMFRKDFYFLPTIKDGSRKVLETHVSRFTWQYNRQKNRILGKVRDFIDIQIIRKYDKFVVLTHEDKPFWGKLKNITVIPNANTFEPIESSRLDQKIVLAVGRYSYEKNYSDLIKAWSSVYQQFPEWKLKIVGDGYLRETLQKQINESHLSHTVELTPSTLDIMNLYLHSSLVVLSSYYEGLGMVLLEGQACGVPLVSYACKCGPRDIITEGENGFLVEVGDINMLSDRIKRVISDDGLRVKMGKSAKVHSLKFSEKAIMERWLMLFTELSNG
ncbi:MULTISPECIES: glycosyltransferase family 4 protein [unclassified Sphingobacterium]|uniref:glycosyltransferase family 4 protein n=1 Tax=unclassified Sphingobacterium TaxID=2609468 RepID=UPI0025D0EE77|nr:MULTISPECIES: glycosyltransferase family 4 protein [unclassified Sphingobacterium]